MSTQTTALGTGRERPVWPVVAAALLAAVASAPVAQAGLQWIIVAFGAIGIGVLLVVTRDRAIAVLVLLVMSLQFLFHKSVGAINEDVHSGANALFVNNIDVLLVVLYALWLGAGTFREDVRAALRRPEIRIPLLGSLAVLPSLFVVTDLHLAVAELLRMTWMYLLFLYVAVRVRTRRDVVLVVGAFFVIAAIQFVIATLQWRTGSSLGLSFLGEESSLGIRTLDDGTVPRPTGTVVHPIFLAALLAPIGCVALSLAIVLRRTRTRLLCLGVAGLAFAPIVLTQARASLAAAGITVCLLLLAMLRSGRLTMRPILVAFGVAMILGLVFMEPIQQKLEDNLGTSQFELEIESRLELNGVAMAMIADSPLLGVGLNQFETVEPQYDQYGLIFAGNPVHNIYLLVASETGLVGLAGFLALYVVAIRSALRAARASDPLFVGVGAGITAALVFFAIEELLSFALRQEMPLALFWILFGLAVACARLAEGDRPAASGMVPDAV